MPQILSALDLQKQGLDLIVRNGGFKFTPLFFPYTSGQIGPYFVQSGDVQKNGVDYAHAVNLMSLLTKEVTGERAFSSITGGETRDWIFSLPVAAELKFPHTMLYKDGKTVGASLEDRDILHVADLNNEGSSMRDYWVPLIRGKGGTVRDVVFFVDRLEDGAEVVRNLDLQSRAVVSLDQHAWNYLLKQNVIDQPVYRSLQTRLEDKTTWAQDMLRSDAGIEHMRHLILDEKTRPKALKVIEVGYPKLTHEIIGKLKAKGMEYTFDLDY